MNPCAAFVKHINCDDIHLAHLETPAAARINGETCTQSKKQETGKRFVSSCHEVTTTDFKTKQNRRCIARLLSYLLL